jgi:tetratricopeptide (TPR) repeat protein
MAGEALRYRAFLSYSHRDAQLAQKLHRKLEGYTVPRSLRGVRADGSVVHARLTPVFRDRDELASAGSLSRSIEEALDASAALIVVCSPAAVASPWVDAEIAYFRRRHPDRPALAFVVAGDPTIDPRADPQHAAFPLNLLRSDVDDPASAFGEPIAADAREQGDGFASAFLKLAAGLLSVRYDQLKQRELRRRQQRWALIAACSMVLTVAFAVLAVRATIARNEARAAQSLAELELTSERQTREFLLSIFNLADANEARGNSVTVREVLDRAVARIDHTEFSRAEIRSRFLATMGQAYSSLGLNKRGVELLRHSIDALGTGNLEPDARTQRIDSRIELADLLYSMGEYDAALAQLDAVSTAHETLSWQQQARLANVRGDVLAYTEKDAEAQAAYREALDAIDRAHTVPRDSVLARARSLSGFALLSMFTGEYAKAEQGYAQVVDLLQPVVGETHPNTIVTVNSLGSAAYQNGDLVNARSDWLRALAAARKVYDPGYSQIATIENNLGRLMLQTGDLAGAEPLLRDALASDRKNNSATFDDLAYPLYNLAFLRFVQGDRDEALKLLDEALPIAENSKHRMYGPILTTLADIHCAAGQLELGASLAERAVTVNREHADIAPWYADQATLTQKYCQAMAGLKVERNTLAPLVAALGKKWGEASPFAQRGLEQVHAIERESARAGSSTP